MRDDCSVVQAWLSLDQEQASKHFAGSLSVRACLSEPHDWVMFHWTEQGSTSPPAPLSCADAMTSLFSPWNERLQTTVFICTHRHTTADTTFANAQFLTVSWSPRLYEKVLCFQLPSLQTREMSCMTLLVANLMLAMMVISCGAALGHGILWAGWLARPAILKYGSISPR